MARQQVENRLGEIAHGTVDVDKVGVTVERRNSLRIAIEDTFVREQNGDYFYFLELENLSEEGVFVRGKWVTECHHYVSFLSLRLPGGPDLKNIPAKIVRETFGENSSGVAFHFVSMNEETRIELKKFLTEYSKAG